VQERDSCDTELLDRLEVDWLGTVDMDEADAGGGVVWESQGHVPRKTGWGPFG
jgi:hypothetical protein